jgi:hypothetical protein
VASCRRQQQWNLKLRTLGPNDQLDRTPVTPARIPEDVLEAEQKKLQTIIERRKRQAKRKPKTD